jgi:hypothetical protein
MAVFIDEPTPISRQDASTLLGSVTSLGVVASPNPGVLSASYIGNFYGSSLARSGEIITLNPSNIMSVLDYAGRLVPAFSFAVTDASTTDGSSPSGAFQFRIGMNVTTTPQTGTPATFSFGLNSPFLNPFGALFSIPAGAGFSSNYSTPMPYPYDAGWTGARFQVFGEKVYNISKANLIAGQLPSFNVKLKIWFAWLGTPPPTGVLQIAYTPIYNDSSIVLPPNYYVTLNAPRGKPVTNRNFSYDNLTELQNPYNILRTPYASAPFVQFPTGGTAPVPPTALNGFNDEASLQAFYRQSPTVALGGPSYQYVAGDTFPASALVMDTDLNIKVFPPLYYVYGVDQATSTINFTYPSYSTNPLDSRP